MLKQEYKEEEMTLEDALKIAVKVLDKTLDITKLTPDKGKLSEATSQGDNIWNLTLIYSTPSLCNPLIVMRHSDFEIEDLGCVTVELLLASSKDLGVVLGGILVIKLCGFWSRQRKDGNLFSVHLVLGVVAVFAGSPAIKANVKLLTLDSSYLSL